MKTSQNDITTHALLLFTLVFLIFKGCTVSAETFKFDHDQTGFSLDGQHRNVDCQDCHVQGQFKGTPVQCEFCHGNRSMIQASSKSITHIMSSENCADCHNESGWDIILKVDHNATLGQCESCHNNQITSGKPANHISSGNDCESCHTDNNWSNIPRIDHAQLTGSCSSCHNGGIASGKHANHFTTTSECDICHTTLAWLPAAFDHADVSGNCVACHSNIKAQGKSNTHILSSNLCENCHNSLQWEPTFKVDHNEVQGSCSSCHDGVSARGKDNDHFLTNGECDQCHSNFAWTPATFDHNTVLGDCASCHNGVTATGKSNQHFTTTQECNVCHNSFTWSPISFIHSSANYPGNHLEELSCADCHTSKAEIVPWPNPSLAPDCGSCHSSDYRINEHHKTKNPTTINYTVSELMDCAGACHEYTDNTFTRIKETRTGEHRVNSGGFD